MFDNYSSNQHLYFLLNRDVKPCQSRVAALVAAGAGCPIFTGASPAQLVVLVGELAQQVNVHTPLPSAVCGAAAEAAVFPVRTPAAIGLPWLGAARLCIQSTTSVHSHALVPGDSFCGGGKAPDFTARQRVALDHGMTPGQPGRGRRGPLPRSLLAAACSGVTGASPISCR